ncbi:MAG: hypothetical protein ACOC56_05650, partial [Atribacterota bacterium]
INTINNCKGVKKMPIQVCKKDGKWGYKAWEKGTCYTHDGSEKGKLRAYKKALQQLQAIKKSQQDNDD